MATGAYDSNGIWQYGEDDSIALFSDTLNKVAASTSSAFTSDRARLATLEAGSLSGLIPVIPPTIVIAGGTGSIGSLGVVTFTNATTVSLNSVFTTAYKNYRVLISSMPASGQVIHYFRLRASGADITNLNYFYAGITASSATSALYGVTAANTPIINGYASINSFCTMDISSPQLAAKTSWISFSNGHNGTAALGTHQSSGFELTTQADGFSIIASASTITGTVQVFGYND